MWALTHKYKQTCSIKNFFSSKGQTLQPNCYMIKQAPLHKFRRETHKNVRSTKGLEHAPISTQHTQQHFAERIIRHTKGVPLHLNKLGVGNADLCGYNTIHRSGRKCYDNNMRVETRAYQDGGLKIIALSWG